MDQTFEQVRASAQKCAEAMEVTILFLPARILRRVIRRHRRISRFGRGIPHANSYQLRGTLLTKMVPSADRKVRDHVYLISEPEEERVPDTWLWRRLFHEHVHALYRDARLSPASVRERIHHIGQVEFDEIRLILRKEDLLLPSRGAGLRLPEAYGEFMATWLEFKYFEPELLARFFPGLTSRVDEIERLVGRDIDGQKVFEITRPQGCLDPELKPPEVEEDEDPLPEISVSRNSDTFRRNAEEARSKGNRVGAAFDLVMAGETAEAEIGSLAIDLSDLTGTSRDRWEMAIHSLVVRGCQRRSSRESRVLFDLQKALINHKSPPQSVDLVEFVLQFGKVPIRRQLRSLQEVLPLKYFRKASSRKLPAEIRNLLSESIRKLEERVRNDLRPRIRKALVSSGFPQKTVVEKVGSQKLVEELLDAVVEKSFFTFGELRDAVARNQARLENLSGPPGGRIGIELPEWIPRPKLFLKFRKTGLGAALAWAGSVLFRHLFRPAFVTLKELTLGDPLLQMDRKLAIPLEGVYRRGEIYLRWLQRFSSLVFGTLTGRFLTRYLVIPFGGAFVILEGMQHLIGPVMEWMGMEAPHFRNPPTWISLGIFLMVLLSFPGFRQGVLTLLRSARRLGTMVVIDAPAWLLRLRPLLWFRRTWLWFGLVRYVIRPGLISLLLGFPLIFLEFDFGNHYYAMGLLFFFVNIGLNTLLGRTLEERAEDWLIRGWRHFAAYLLPNLVRWILELFNLLLEGLEKFIYRVDELLLFRIGDPFVAVCGKAVLGILWFYVTYLIRIYINVLVEPQVNPIKHFPVVTVSHKIILPLTVTLVELFRTPFLPLGSLVADTMAVITVFLLPGMFGFLVWEWKENWRLYRANRSRFMEPVLVGHHGETMPRLIRPGFHSGTIPKAFSRMRREQRKGKSSGKPEKILRQQEESIRRFFEREFIAILDLSPGMKETISIGEIRLTSNCIRVSFGSHGVLSFEEQSGWMVVGMKGGSRDPIFLAALDGVYRLAGVDLVREELERVLPTNSQYDLVMGGIMVWPDSDFVSEIFYPLKRLLPFSRPRFQKSQVREIPPPIRMRELVFRKTPLKWTTWETRWEEYTRPVQT